MMGRCVCVDFKNHSLVPINMLTLFAPRPMVVSLPAEWYSKTASFSLVFPHTRTHVPWPQGLQARKGGQKVFKKASSTPSWVTHSAKELWRWSSRNTRRILGQVSRRL